LLMRTKPEIPTGEEFPKTSSRFLVAPKTALTFYS
jgi:hypothetical protein